MHKRRRKILPRFRLSFVLRSARRSSCSLPFPRTETKVYDREVGQRREYPPVSNSRDKIGVINVTARSNFAGKRSGTKRGGDRQATLDETPFKGLALKTKKSENEAHPRSEVVAIAPATCIYIIQGVPF